MNLAAIFWLIAMVAFFILEAGTDSLVALWFAGGSLVALILALCHAGTVLQIVAFVIVSAILLALLRPVLRRHIVVKKTSTNADRLIGLEAVVTQSIGGGIDTGEVRVSGVLWTALCDVPVEQGTHVRIERVAGAKLYVSPIPAAAGTEG